MSEEQKSKTRLGTLTIELQLGTSKKTRSFIHAQEHKNKNNK